MICQFRLLVCKLPNPKVTCFYLLRYQENHIFRKRKELQTTSSSGDFNVCVWGQGLTIKSNWILFDTARCFPTCLLPTLTLKVWSLGSSISIRGNLLKRHLLGPCPIKSEILEVGSCVSRALQVILIPVRFENHWHRVWPSAPLFLNPKSLRCVGWAKLTRHCLSFIVLGSRELLSLAHTQPQCWRVAKPAFKQLSHIWHFIIRTSKIILWGSQTPLTHRWRSWAQGG